MAQFSNRPSVVVGLKTALRLWSLVFVVWLVGLAVMSPAVMMLEGAAESALNRIPDGFEPPPGDIAIMLRRAVLDVGDPLVVAVGVGLLLAWAWTVLWHAGVARYVVWDGDGPVSVAKILGLGLGAWWRYCRLSLIALTALVVMLATIWIPILWGVKSAFAAMEENRLVVLVVVGIVLSGLAKMLVWAATSRAAWELAKPTSRSAVMAWMRGVRGVFSQPLSTFAALLTFVVPAVVCALVPVLAPVFLPPLRGTALGDAVGLFAGLGTTCAMVALFAAFAPVSGVVKVGSPDPGLEG